MVTNRNLVAGRRSWPRYVLACAIAGHLAVAADAGLNVDRHTGDFDRFWSLATSPGRPYVDFAVEYPPGTLVAFRALAGAVGNRDTFRLALVATNVAADMAIVFVLGSVWGTGAALYFALAVTPILAVLMFRVDLWSTAAAAIAIAAWQREHRSAAAIVLWVGISLKMWPLPLGVLLLVRRRRRDSRVAAALLIVGLALLVGWWWSLAGAGGLAEVLTFRHAQGWQIESTIGSIVRLIDAGSLREEQGAWRVGSTGGVTSIVLFLLAVVPSVSMIWLGATQDRVGVAWVASIGAILVCSSLLSPQFLVWLIPGAAIAWSQNDRALALLAVVVVVETLLYRWLRLWPPLVIARNITLLALTCAAIASLLTRRPGGESRGRPVPARSVARR